MKIKPKESFSIGENKKQFITPKEFREKGYLLEINRQFLHPLGLCLRIIRHIESGLEYFEGIEDLRRKSGGAGIIFSDFSDEDKKKSNKLVRKQLKARTSRYIKYGFIIQPLGNEDPLEGVVENLLKVANSFV